VTALLVALAASVSLGPPSPVLHSQGERLVATVVSSCWRYPPDEDGVTRAICADGILPADARRLAVKQGGRVRIDMARP
jgi:hypothetical protein